MDLYATTKFDPSANRLRNARKYVREIRNGDCLLIVAGDESVDSCCAERPGFSLICEARLFASLTVPVAEYLADRYARMGDAFVRDLRGSFAIIVSDHATRSLKAWTDHFGIERLVYTQYGEAAAVASDIRLLLSITGKTPDLDLAAVREYLLYTCIPTPRTIYRNISKLAPGNQLTAASTLQTKAYWDVSYDGPAAAKSESQWAADTRSAVKQAVARNLEGLQLSEASGCFLSGGTDSSSVSGLCGEILGRPPKTFSIGFDDPRYNEIEYARIAARKFAADHHEYFVKPDDILSLVHQAVRIYDEPFGNSSIVPTYYCARLAAEKGVTHLLAGDGGDELFGGNERYASDQVFPRYHMLPGWIRQWLLEPAVSTGARWTGMKLFRQASSYTRRSNIPAPDRYFSYTLVSSTPGAELFTDEFLRTVSGDPLDIARRHFAATSARSELNRWLYLDLKIIISDNDLRKVTRMSRLAGVTPRYPLLDPDLAVFAGTIPAGLKVRGSQLRYLFKKAMADVLPQEIISKTKHGFGIPYAVWLAEHRTLRDFTFDTLGSARCRQRGYFRSDLLERIWEKYETSYRGFYGEILWLLVMLELWHQAQVDAHPEQQPEALRVTS